MRKQNLAQALLAMLLVCLMLAACSAKGQQGAPSAPVPTPTAAPATPPPTPVPTPTPMPDTVFQERTPGDSSFITELLNWVDTERTAIITDERNDAVAAGDLYPTYADAFAAANALFKEEDYGAAADGYAQILAECPGHLGAMNNYALAMMHLGDYETALKNVVLLGTLHQDYQGTWANFVLGCYALGFDARDVLAELQAAGLPFPEVGVFIADVQAQGVLEENALYRAYAYNSMYSSMEFPLRYIGPDADMMQAELDMKLASDEISFEEANNLLVANNFDEWQAALENLNAIEADADMEALLDYAIGLRKLRTMDE